MVPGSLSGKGSSVSGRDRAPAIQRGSFSGVGLGADNKTGLYSDRGSPRGVRSMKMRMQAFGEIEVEGERYDYDLVIEQGGIRKRSKKPSSTPVS